MLALKLKELKMLSNANLDILVQQVTCSLNFKKCMYGECKVCSNKTIQIENVDWNLETTWRQWKTVTEARVIKTQGSSVTRDVTLTIKSVQSGPVSEIVRSFSEQLMKFKVHNCNIQHQYFQYRLLRNEMSASEVLIHIDYSENYVAKLAKEIQSVHFGASKNQITIHSGLYYVGSNSVPNTFATVSDSLEHGPAGVWAYLRPVLDYIQSKHPAVDTLHFFSDGPTTQYRQKINFYMFTQMISERKFRLGTWNFHEAGHGKSVPDGVGAALKRTSSF